MKRVTAIIIVLGLVIALSSALSAGTADDPLISLSYINNTFLPSLIEEVKSSAATALATVADEAEQKLSEVTNGYILTAPGYSFTSGYFSCPAVAGAVLELAPGSSAVLVNGTAKLTIKSGDVVDLQTGSLLSSGNILSGNSRIFATEEASASLTVYSNTAELYVDGSYRFSQGNGVAPGVVFNDIPNDHWALEYIYVLAEQKLVNGTGNLRFEPETTMNRAMFVTVIGRLADVDTSRYRTSAFSDVDISEWYGPYVAWAAENKIVSGTGNGAFSPEDPITREQMAVIIMRYVSFSGITLQDKNESVDFVDNKDIDTWAYDSVYAAQRAGLINGNPNGTFDPLGTAKRAEVCAVIYRLINR